MNKFFSTFLFVACTILIMSACRTVRETEKVAVDKGSSETSHSETLQSASLFSVLNTLSMSADSIVIWMQDGGSGYNRLFRPATISTADSGFTEQSYDLLNPGICPDGNSMGNGNSPKSKGSVPGYILPTTSKRYHPPESNGNMSVADKNSSMLTPSRYSGVSKIVISGLHLDAKTESIRSSSLSWSDSSKIAAHHEKRKSSSSKSSPSLDIVKCVVFCIIIVILTMIIVKWLRRGKKE